MKQFLVKYNLVLFSLVAVSVLLYTLTHWQTMPVTQRSLVSHYICGKRAFSWRHSPGLVTAVVILMPISLYTIHYIAANAEIHFSTWLLAFLFMAARLMIAQRIVISASRMRYSEFLKNVRTRLFSAKK